MTDLFVSDHAPVLGTGRAMRVYGVVRALAALGPVDFVYAPFGAEQPADAFQAIERATFHVARPSRGAARALTYAAARAGGAPRPFARGISPELRGLAERLATVPGRGRVVADGPTAAAALARLARRRPVIYNAHNMESTFRSRTDPENFPDPEALRRFERRLLASAAESWMVSRPDLAAAKDLCPGARLRYVPNAIDVAAVRPATGSPGGSRLLFVADFTYAPNRSGLRFLVDEVMPRVWERVPEAHLTLVGRGLEERPSPDARIEPVGFVDDLGSAYRSAACAVVPLLGGGGSPLKFIEALAYGLPVVSTAHAAALLDGEPGRHFLVGGDGAAFAAAVVRVLRGEAGEVGPAGRALAEARYSIAALRDAIAAPPAA